MGVVHKFHHPNGRDYFFQSWLRPFGLGGVSPIGVSPNGGSPNAGSRNGGSPNNPSVQMGVVQMEFSRTRKVINTVVVAHAASLFNKEIELEEGSARVL